MVMKLQVVFSIFCLFFVAAFGQECFSQSHVQTLEIPSWSYLRVKSFFDGVLTIVNGSDLYPASLEVRAFSDNEEVVKEVYLNVATNGNKTAFVIAIEDVFRAPPVPPESEVSPEEYDENNEDEESAAGFLRPSSILPLGVSAGLLANNHPKLAALPLGAYILQSAYAQQQNCSVYVNITLTVPNAFAVDLGVLPRIEYASNNVIDFSMGNEDFIECNDTTTGPSLCPSSNVKCSVNGVSGECIDYRSCSSSQGKKSVSGYCPGPWNIRCCISESCRTSSGLSGTCRDTTECRSNYGSTHAGLCPGPSNIQCCTSSTCRYGSSTGVCQPTSSSCSGTYRAGLCPGPSNIQCCVRGGGSSSTPTGSGYSFPKPRTKEGVPFAPMTGVYWPLSQSSPSSRAPVCYDDVNFVGRQSPSSPVATNFGCSARKFFASRSGGRYHSGIDLYAPAGTRVIATEPGRIVNSYFFYESVCCVIQQTDSGVVVNYGEISCSNRQVRVGQRVNAGDTIGYVGNLRCCHPMLHFETYRQGTTANQRSYRGNVDSRVLDPTEYLLTLRENGR